MTATLGETYAGPETQAIDAAAAQTALQTGRRRSVRRARQELTAGIAHTAVGHRVTAAMLGLLAAVTLAGALVQAVAG